jgi:carbon storage regulator
VLVLTRKPNESIMIGDEVEISVVEIKGDHVKLGITAPRRIKVHRKEVFEAIHRENVAAARTDAGRIGDIESLFGGKKSE